MSQVPDKFTVGTPAGGTFQGIFPIHCRHCNKAVALLRFDEPIIDSQFRALVTLGKQLGVPACIDYDQYIEQVWPTKMRWSDRTEFWSGLAHEHK